jgi:hypothetical protein
MKNKWEPFVGYLKLREKKNNSNDIPLGTGGSERK